MWQSPATPEATGQPSDEQPLAFGPYQILARIAAGGMANVLLAREPRPEGARLVTLKTILPELTARKDVVEMFLDEIALSQRLTHPNCVRTYGSGQLAGTHFMTMEFLLGDTVGSLIQRARAVGRPLPPRAVASIVASAADGLHYVHELTNASGEPLDLIHRDVCPQNVMVTYDGAVKLLDFGIAASKTRRQVTITGIIKGKLRYMSLEQLTGRTIDRRADVYSLGVVLFEALTGERLIQVESQDAAIEVLTSRPLPSPQDFRPDLPDEVVWITSRALALHAPDRYPTAKLMADELRAFIQRSPGPPVEEELAACLESLVATKIATRRALCDRIIAGDIDLPAIRSAFRARKMLRIDLHPAAEDLELGQPSSLIPLVLSDRPISPDENPTVDAADVPDISLIIEFEPPVDWPGDDVATVGRLERVLPELSSLADRSAAEDRRLLELANLWLTPPASKEQLAAVAPPIEAVKSEEITVFEEEHPPAPATKQEPRSSRLLLGLVLGALLGLPLGSLMTWFLLKV